MKQFIHFENQVCLVTGAGSADGIGFKTAKIMGELGGKIALVATGDRIHERATELQELGIRAKGYAADLMDRSQVEALVAQVLDDFGKIDVLVNNAGLSMGGVKVVAGHMSDMPYETWDISIDRNLTLCFNVTRNVLPAMIKNGYGRIVNVSSVTGPLVSTSGDTAYGAAKSAICGMSKALAIEVAPSGITVNNVLPGWIKTAVQSERGRLGGQNTPMKRSSEPEEVANAVVFLASKEASYITGQDLVVDGGNIIQEFKGGDAIG